MRVSIVQNEIKWGVKNENLLSFDKLIKTVYGQTDLVVLPEPATIGRRRRRSSSTGEKMGIGRRFCNSRLHYDKR